MTTYMILMNHYLNTSYHYLEEAYLLARDKDDQVAYAKLAGLQSNLQHLANWLNASEDR